MRMPGKSLSAMVIAVATAWWPAHSPAAALVSWGGDYVGGTAVQFANLSGSNLGGFSGGNPLQLSPASGYSGGRFYGHVAWTEVGADGNYGGVVNSSAKDRLEFKRYNTDIKGLVLWRQADFLNGLDSGNVGFDGSSTASMYLNTLVGFESGRVVLRLQGGSNDGYYISQETPFSAATKTTTANLTSITWLAYDPASSLTTFGSPVNLLSSGKIEHVTEVGYYSRSNMSGSPNAFRLDTFTVSAIAIPEPTALCVAAMVATLTLGSRRRRD